MASSDPSVLLSDLLAAIAIRNNAAQKLADAVANQTKVSQEAAAQTKAANAALVAATSAQSSAHKALADLLATLEGSTPGTPTPSPVGGSKIPPALPESSVVEAPSA
jgi:hypothetical protein